MNFLGRLKPLVNDPSLYTAFKEYLEHELLRVQKTMETATDPLHIYRAQGEVARLRRFLQLRELVNVSDKT